MNIDILNAYCGIGFHRCHACLRVGLLAIAPVLFGVRICGRLGSLSQLSRCSSVALNADRSSVHNSERQSSSTWHRPAVRTVARLLFRSSPPPGSNFSWSSPHRDVFLLPVPADYVIPGSTLRSDLTCRPEIRRDYPLNLSISLSGGKETNKDSPSNGE